ncbi:MAG: carboxylesterase/lipase family protein [Schwartzia sp.]|nr:carboxylesterase/lipase family protein [Schwartzia sp. (in: firmicutes)]
MKKLFTIEDFAIALVAALGYGFCFEIPKVLGCPIWLCTVICLVVGVSLEMMEHKLVFSKAVQKTPARRYTALAVIVLVFLVALFLAVSWTDMDVLDYVVGQYGYIIILPLLIFAFRMGVRWYRVRKIRERYGDGSGGFVFDGQLTEKDFEEARQQNRPIRGEFDADLAAKTRTGVFVGRKDNGVLLFAGIPYAKPPVGELRWKAPEPLPASDEVFEAKYIGASAIQVDYDGSVLAQHRQSEDCLTLNIGVVGEKTKRKKPVLVIFHHGDFSYGGSADPLLWGDDFAKIYPDTIGVTFNFRLGLFGFIDFSEVPGGEAYPDALNLGLLDQIAALRWIKENIAAFGGDPERITVMGFEAGALSISLLAACEQAKGLFQKAVFFNGSPLMAYETPETSKNLAKKLLQETKARTMEDLLRLPEQRLKEAMQTLAMDSSAPTRDGKLVPEDVYAAYRDGVASGVEFLVGIPSNERNIYKSFVGNQKYADFMAKETSGILRYLDARYPAEVKAARAYIEEQAATSSTVEAQAKLFEQVYALSTYCGAKKLAEGGNNVHLFYWAAKPLIENLGSGTVDVMATFLGSQRAAQMYGNVLNPDIAETLQTLFRKFESGETMRLHHNEIKGIDAIDWKEFPDALIVSEKAFRCGPITEKLTEVKELLKLLDE